MGSGDDGHAGSGCQVQHVCALCGLTRVVQGTRGIAAPAGGGPRPGTRNADRTHRIGLADEYTRTRHRYHHRYAVGRAGAACRDLVPGAEDNSANRHGTAKPMLQRIMSSVAHPDASNVTTWRVSSSESKSVGKPANTSLCVVSINEERSATYSCICCVHGPFSEQRSTQKKSVPLASLFQYHALRMGRTNGGRKDCFEKAHIVNRCTK